MLQLALPLELAPPLELSQRLVQGAPAADLPRMVGPATLALAATLALWRLGAKGVIIYLM